LPHPFLDRVKQSDFVRNTVILASGTLFSQVFNFIATPISSRIFSPENYGALGIYMGLTGILGTLAFSHYPQAIFLAEEEKEARNLIWFCGAVAAGICCLIALGIGVVFSMTTWLDAIGYWAFAIPVSVMLNAISGILMVWANRTKQYKIITKNRVAQTVLTILVQLSVGYFVHQKYGLMAGLLTGQVLGAVLLVRPFLFRKSIRIGRPDTTFFKEYAVRYRRFALYATPSDFINNLINQLPIYFLQGMAGLNYVGNYAFAQRLLGLPSTLLGGSIADVFRQKAAETYRERGECRDLFVKTARTLFLVGIGPLVLTVLFAPQIFAFVFGENWRMAGEMARILSPLFFLRIIVSPLSYLFTLAGRMREDLLIHLGSVAAISTAFSATNYLFNDKDLLIGGYAVAYMGIYLIYLTRSYQFAQGPTVSA
jgi:O-antigen/teichoic acid export membrane protein